jgi:hypothetical protein
MENVKAVALKHWGEFTENPFEKSVNITFGMIGLSIGVVFMAMALGVAIRVLNYSWTFVQGSF